MREIIGFIRLYIREIEAWRFFMCTALMAVLVYLNYYQDLESNIYLWPDLPLADFTAPALVYSIAFLPALLISFYKNPRTTSVPAFVIFLLLLAPVLFAIKVGLTTYLEFFSSREWELYWNKVLYWPLRLLVLMVILWVLARLLGKPREVLGLEARSFKWKPYFGMLLIMIPLIAAASTQDDFLQTYPKVQQVFPLPENAQPSWWYVLLYELGYGSDFISIEVFFRGFLVIGFSRWLGRDAILPMACFYCSIHFGKPVGECISSYFGGLLLGIVSAHTRNVYGGLVVHLGIAWLMEVGGYLGNYLTQTTVTSN